jgi:hypothetical protein|tara:strand:- start:565 stop:735 length:171 start_codon:yes stop_codon:yes gene_type:complete
MCTELFSSSEREQTDVQDLLATCLSASIAFPAMAQTIDIVDDDRLSSDRSRYQNRR